MHVADRVSTELCAESAFYINRKTTETAVLLLFPDKLFDSVEMISPPENIIPDLDATPEIVWRHPHQPVQSLERGRFGKI
jgi:hypothetical protein